jgi:hypothetical protein
MGLKNYPQTGNITGLSGSDLLHKKYFWTVSYISLILFQRLKINLFDDF